jgi:hypothetical protein
LDGRGRDFILSDNYRFDHVFGLNREPVLILVWLCSDNDHGPKKRASSPILSTIRAVGNEPSHCTPLVDELQARLGDRMQLSSIEQDDELKQIGLEHSHIQTVLQAAIGFCADSIFPDFLNDSSEWTRRVAENSVAQAWGWLSWNTSLRLTVAAFPSKANLERQYFDFAPTDKKHTLG